MMVPHPTYNEALRVLSESCSSYCLDDEDDRVHCASVLARRLGMNRYTEAIYNLLSSKASSRCLDDDDDARAVARLISDHNWVRTRED